MATDDSTPQYGANCPISLPQPVTADPGAKADMGGFAFITTGLVHDLTETDRASLISQGFGPSGGFDGQQ
jgi:hypothetical protein